MKAENISAFRNSKRCVERRLNQQAQQIPWFDSSQRVRSLKVIERAFIARFKRGKDCYQSGEIGQAGRGRLLRQKAGIRAIATTAPDVPTSSTLPNASSQLSPNRGTQIADHR
jgi:hypothetical protein